MQRKIIRWERGNVTGDWLRLHSTELHDFYSSNIIRMIKSRRVGWAGLAGQAGRREIYAVWWGNVKEGDHLVDLHVDDKIILKLYLKRTV